MKTFIEWMKLQEGNATASSGMSKEDERKYVLPKDRAKKQGEAMDRAWQKRNSTVGDDSETAADSVGANFPKYKSVRMKKS